MKKYILLISVFLVALMFCGAVSATSYYISENGKNLNVKPYYATSTLKNTATVTLKTGNYGYGYYGTIKTAGRDVKGNTIYRTGVYFNKNTNQFSGKDFKLGILKQSNPDRSYITSYIKTSNNIMTESFNGRTFNGLTFSGKATYTLYGNGLTQRAVMTTAYYQNGNFYAIFKSTLIPIYKYIASSYKTVKWTSISSTTYKNGDTRRSFIITLFTRNYNGVLIGQKTYGTSSGTEKVSGKTVIYSGKITTNTRYDANDIWHEKYVTGGYYENKTSTSPTLVRRLPFEAL